MAQNTTNVIKVLPNQVNPAYSDDSDDEGIVPVETKIYSSDDGSVSSDYLSEIEVIDIDEPIQFHPGKSEPRRRGQNLHDTWNTTENDEDHPKSKINIKSKHKPNTSSEDNEDENKSQRKISSSDVFGNVVVYNHTKPKWGIPDFTVTKSVTMFQSVFVPPPPGYLVRCQINKTNKKDKTNLLTLFIFSVQLDRNEKTGIYRTKPLMAARNRKKSKTPNYVISLDYVAVRSQGKGTIGKLRSNLGGSKFSFYKKMSSEVNVNLNKTQNDETASEESEEESLEDEDKLKKEFQKIGSCFYRGSKFKPSKPRKVQSIIPTFNDKTKSYDKTELPESWTDDVSQQFEKLTQIEPIYNAVKKRYTLDFGGRAKDASVKNYALNMNIDGEEKRVFQVGKSGDHFIVDFTYPLCAFQAFCLGLSTCCRKLAMN